MEGEETSGWGSWDDTKRIVRPATAEETASLAAFEAKLLAYHSGENPPPAVTPPVEETPAATPTPPAGKGKASPAKGKAKGKGKEPEPAAPAASSRPSSANAKNKVVPVGPPVSPVEVAGTSEGVLMVYARVTEPTHEIDKTHPDQTVVVTCNAVADAPKFTCESHQGKINFRPTYMLQSTWLRQMTACPLTHPLEETTDTPNHTPLTYPINVPTNHQALCIASRSPTTARSPCPSAGPWKTSSSGS